MHIRQPERKQEIKSLDSRMLKGDVPGRRSLKDLSALQNFEPADNIWHPEILYTGGRLKDFH